ncbi:hypothetical protein [Mesorhizobium sp. WSM3860]|uniref:hypothetical protein n=1 Tax=Mesorhizobium sp. WSM3860 TaxID=2029403 RepID=UPI0015971145|nr:hypothetical protein [Mesorhizobium sp. WSM3860]
MPTLVLHARTTRSHPSNPVAMAAGIPGARFIELESQNQILLEGEFHVRAFIAETAGR